MIFLKLPVVRREIEAEEQTDVMRELGIVSHEIGPWDVSPTLVEVTRIQDVYKDSPRGEDLDYCSITTDSGDVYLVALTLETVEAVLISVGAEVTDLT